MPALLHSWSLSGQVTPKTLAPGGLDCVLRGRAQGRQAVSERGNTLSIFAVFGRHSRASGAYRMRLGMRPEQGLLPCAGPRRQHRCGGGRFGDHGMEWRTSLMSANLRTHPGQLRAAGPARWHVPAALRGSLGHGGNTRDERSNDTERRVGRGRRRGCRGPRQSTPRRLPWTKLVRVPPHPRAALSRRREPAADSRPLPRAAAQRRTAEAQPISNLARTHARHARIAYPSSSTFT
jgi:hypothetical protein